jgi:phage terminase Nu1 subunit (DNA packaging protein)
MKSKVVKENQKAVVDTKCADLFFDNLISTSELLNLFKEKVSRPTVTRWIKRGLPHYRIDQKLFFDKTEVVSWVRSRG